MCQKFAKTALAKQKHAEFMLKLAEVIYGIVLTGVLGTSVLAWFSSSKDAQFTGTFDYFVFLSVAGVIGAMILQSRAMSIFNQPNETAVVSQSPSAVTTDTTDSLNIQIKHGNTVISINTHSEKNDAQ